MEGKSFTALIKILGLDESGNVDHILVRQTLGFDGECLLGRHFLLAFYIGSNDRDGISAFFLGIVGQRIRSLGQCAYQQVIGIDSYIGNGAGGRLRRHGNYGRIAHGDGRWLHRVDSHGDILVLFVRAESQVLDIETTLADH